MVDNRTGGTPPDPPARTSLVDGAEQAVRDWLRPGRFRPGDRLPTEEQLAERLGISRGTLRSALRRLEDSGEIVRRQGSGTFVGSLPSTKFAVPWLRADSYSTRPRVGTMAVVEMSVELAPVGGPAASLFGVDPDRPGVQIRRVLAAAEVPMAFSLDVLHPDLRLPDLATVRARLVGGGTVHAMLVATTGIAFSLNRTRIGSRLVDPDEPLGRRLALAEPTACVVLDDVSTGDGRTIHYAQDVVVPLHVEIEVVQSSLQVGPEPISERRLSAGG